jgi:hypothetical protein
MERALTVRTVRDAEPPLKPYVCARGDAPAAYCKASPTQSMVATLRQPSGFQTLTLPAVPTAL